MKITVLGANGKTGVELVKKAITAGHEVVGLVQTQKESKFKNYTQCTGDATNIDDVVKASTGSDVILSVLGTISNKTSLQTDAVKAVIGAGKKTGVKRFIVESAYTVEPERTKPVLRFVTQHMMRGMIADKSKSEKLLRDSDLDWTIVRPVTLNNSGSIAEVRVMPLDENVGFKHKISRSSVASWMLVEVENNNHVKKSVFITQ